MSRRAGWLLPSALLVVVLGCARCGGQKSGVEARVVERVLGRGAVAVVVVPHLAGLGHKLELFERLKVASFLAPTQGFADSRAFADALVSELGVDVRSPAALRAAGLDGAGPLGGAVQVTGQAYVALPVEDATKLEAALAALAKSRLGAPVAGQRVTGDVTVKTFARSGEGPPRLGYVVAHGFALVAVDEGVSSLVALAGLPEGDSLLNEPALAKAKARLGALGDGYVYLPPGSPLLSRTPLESALFTVSLEPSSFRVELDAPWASGVASGTLLEPQSAAADLTPLLPSDAFVVARYDGPPAALGPVARRVLGRGVGNIGRDLEEEVLPHLKPGVAVALSLAERPPLGRGLPDDVRRTNPFVYVGLSGVAALDGPDAGVVALERAAAWAPKLGAEMRRADRAGATAFITSWAQGEGLHFAVRGDRAYFASPVERLDQLLAGDGGSAVPARADGGPALFLRFDLSKLARSVRALPESAWGLGGFAMKGTMVRWLDAMDDLKALTLEVSSKDKVARASLGLSLSPKQEP